MFALALLGAVLLGPCFGVCSGWKASADARMACCAGKSTDEAELCCASAEGRQNSESLAGLTTVGLPPLEPVALKIAAVLGPEPPATFVLDSHDPLTADCERHVLLSVFLI